MNIFPLIEAKSHPQCPRNWGQYFVGWGVKYQFFHTMKIFFYRKFTCMVITFAVRFLILVNVYLKITKYMQYTNRINISPS